jgi:molybdate transport system substrate-binding protein
MTGKKARKRIDDLWTHDWNVNVRVSVDRRGETVLDQPVADLLIALDRTGSISAAAKKTGISYRHAWLLLNTANVNAGAPLFEATVGGTRGGGTQLTDYGRNALVVFQQIQRHVGSAAAKSLPRIVRSAGHEPTVVHLAAAISLQEALAQVLTDYALVRPTMVVRTMFGASNELADQILSGAEIDLFISANEHQISRLARAKLIASKSRRPIVSNSLAVVGPQEFVGVVRKPADLQSKTDSAIVIADPACPLGECTTNFLKSTGLVGSLKSRLQYAESSRAVVSSLRTNALRIAVVFESDIQNLIGAKALFRIPASRASTIYEGAVIARSTVMDEAAAVLQFLKSRRAKACFKRCGFVA